MSNHLLFGSNPLKVWGYQEDVVRFTGFDDRLVPPSYKGQTLVGRSSRSWSSGSGSTDGRRQGRRADDLRLPADRPTDGEHRDGPGVANTAACWEMGLMDFRLIQPEGPNRCRW